MAFVSFGLTLNTDSVLSRLPFSEKALLLTIPKARVLRHKVITGILNFSAADFMGTPDCTKSMARSNSSGVHFRDLRRKNVSGGPLLDLIGLARRVAEISIHMSD
jgi:hypothetical protein